MKVRLVVGFLLHGSPRRPDLIPVTAMFEFDKGDPPGRGSWCFPAASCSVFSFAFSRGLWSSSPSSASFSLASLFFLRCRRRRRQRQHPDKQQKPLRAHPQAPNVTLRAVDILELAMKSRFQGKTLETRPAAQNSETKPV